MKGASGESALDKGNSTDKCEKSSAPNDKGTQVAGEIRTRWQQELH